MSAAVVALALAVTAADGSAPAGTPFDVTGTSTVASLPATTPDHTVEARTFQKRERFIARAGFAFLSRGDLYTSPGIGAELTFHPTEVLGIDLASATLFFSSLTTTAAELRRTTGLLPDSQKPILRLTTGARLSFAYGKVLVEGLDTVVHLDAAATMHVGLLLTDSAPNFAGDLGLAIQARAFERLLVTLEGAWLGSYERRTTSNLASGPLATIGLGLLL